MSKEQSPAEAGENTQPETVLENNQTDTGAENAASVTDPMVAEVEKLKAELSEQKDKYLRLYSEFDNYRRRTAKEKLEVIKTASEDLILALLPVVDDMERARLNLESTNEISALKEGLDLVFHKMNKVLAAKGLKQMETKGQAFDANLHEAITQFPGDESLKGKVIEELEKGYFLHEKAIRFAKVVIGA